MRFFKKYKTGIALSGGGVRGVAHIGVLKAMEEKCIFPDAYAGTSSGAIVSAFHIMGIPAEGILEIIVKLKKGDLVKPTIPRTGFFKTQGLRSILEYHFGNRKIESLEKPLFVAATNLVSGQAEYLYNGNIVDALMASASVPVLFQPVMINNIPYVDGGVMDNLPVDCLTGLCKKIIAVNVNALDKLHKFNNVMKIGERAFHLAIASGLKYKKEKADIFIEPPGLLKYGLMDIKKAREIYNVGYNTACETLKVKKLKNDNNPGAIENQP